MVAVRIRRAWASVALTALVVAGAACQPGAREGEDPGADGSPSAGQPQAGDPSASPAADGSSTALPDDPSATAIPPGTTIDPAMAVDAPAPFRAPTANPDILVASDSSLDPEVITRVGEIDGVAEVLPISVGQVVVESRVYDLAIVDAGTYRRFVSAEAATNDEIWERVANGELGVLPAVQRRLPINAEEFVRLGTDGEDPIIHVGAYAPQIPTIELVANAKWGEKLGIPEANALLVSTGTGTPQAVREEVQEAIGSDLAPQMLDIASRRGLDPDVFQTVVPVGTFADAVGTFTYTPTGGGRIEPAASWVREHIVTETVPILGQVTCNKYLMPQLKAAMQEIVTTGLADEINPDEYAGCYYPRFIAGSTSLSNHSFGLALDMNVPGNLRGTVGEMDRGVVAIFKKWGFAWGGDWSYTDPMHFELSRIVTPG